MTAPEDPGRAPSRQSLAKALALVVRLTVVIFAIAVFPTLIQSVWVAARLYLPYGTEPFLFDLRSFLFALGAIAILGWRPRHCGLCPLPESFWVLVDRASDWLAGGGLRLAVGGLACWWFVTWAPHYLGWPFWSDTDHFALSALSWDRGIVPYRDLLDFNFPGPFYVHGLIGNTVGWGRTVPVYAIDAAMVAGLAASLVWWSRRRFGDSLAGWCAFLLFAGYYFQQGYPTVAQRDWQATWMCVVGLILLEAGTGRSSWWIPALLFGSAMGFRPHAVLFGPAFLCALVIRSRRDGAGGFGGLLRDVASWGMMAAVTLVLHFVPVMLEGAFDDFLRNFESAWYGGSKNQGNTASLSRRIADELSDGRTILRLLAVAVLSLWPGARLGGSARLWGLGLLGASLFRPLSPIGHGYLAQPRILLEAICLAVILAATRELRAFQGRRAVWFVALAMALVFDRTPYNPRMCSASDSIEQLRSYLTGVPLEQLPRGCRYIFTASQASDALNWSGYLQTIDYLRRHTDADTRVANVIQSYPYPPVNSPTARLSPFPCAEGIQWLYWVDRNLEGRFIEELIRRRERPTVVVWCPRRNDIVGSNRLIRLEQAIQDHFEFEAEFFAYEIWRQKANPVRVRREGPRTPGNPGSEGSTIDGSVH